MVNKSTMLDGKSVTNRKVLIIGIDGGTWTILRPAMEAGYMPYLQKLVSDGASGVLESTIPAITPAAWGSFQTGRNPGENGVYDFSCWDKQLRQCRFVSASKLKDTMWEIASRAGKKVGVLNVPMSYPPRQINGYMVSGVLTPGIDSEFTYPKSFKDELLKSIPDYTILNLGMAVKTLAEDAKKQREDFVRQMVQNIDCRSRAAQLIINKEPLDLFMVHFHAGDIIQHGLWGYMDKTHWLYDEEMCNFLFENFYRQLDKRIEQVRKAFAQSVGGGNAGDFLTLIISDHGFQAHRKRFFLRTWLIKQGFLVLNRKAHSYQNGNKVFGRNQSGRGDKQQQPRLLKRITRKLKVGKIIAKLLPEKAMKKVNRFLTEQEQLTDWQRSRVYSLGGCGEGMIFLLEEKEQKRQVTSNELTEKLLALRDPQTNKPVVAKVHRKEDIYHGRYFEDMPDLIVEPADGYSFMSSLRDDDTLIEDIVNDPHMGKHHTDGIIVAAGSDIQSRSDLRTSIINVAPTVLNYLGVGFRLDKKGKVIDEIFRRDFKQESQIIDGGESGGGNGVVSNDTEPQENDPYSARDNKEIENRLRDLGYM